MQWKYGSVLAMGLLCFSCATVPQWGEMPMEHVAVYTVEGSNLVLETSEQEDVRPSRPVADRHRVFHQAIWDRAREIIPDAYEHYIRYFDISSDGLEGGMAYVEPGQEDGRTDLSSWTLSMDIVDSVDHMGEFRSEELDITLIHEFAHILSINDGQADPVAVEDYDDDRWIETWDFTDRYRTFDAVFRKDSYLNRFFQEFWGAEQIQEWFAVEAQSKDEAEYWTVFTALTVHYHTDFVSDYAMTNPEEDFAESFTHFVLEEKPTGELLSHRKIRFFYDYPELVRIRDEIRAVLPAE